MSLPATLPPNTVSIYGYHSINGIGIPVPGYLFGIIDQMYFGAEENLVGQSVLFAVEKSLKMNYNNAQYFLIQQEDIILTETEIES